MGTSGRGCWTHGELHSGAQIGEWSPDSTTPGPPRLQACYTLLLREGRSHWLVYTHTYTHMDTLPEVGVGRLLRLAIINHLVIPAAFSLRCLCCHCWRRASCTQVPWAARILTDTQRCSHIHHVNLGVAVQ